MNAHEFLESLKPTRVTLGLERMKEFLALLPYRERGNAIIVAGTNGKGSTACMVANLLQSAGYKVGLYTSPHLVGPEERIRINGTPLDPKGFEELIHLCAHYHKKTSHPPTYFETLTAAALLHFQQEDTDWNVLEVGLGGRLDATNVVQSPYAAITHIGRDHTAILGSTLIHIAREKAGIFKRGQRVFSLPQPKRVELTLQEEAKKKGATLSFLSKSSLGKILGEDGDGMLIKLPFQGNPMVVYLPLMGRYQRENALLALHLAQDITNLTAETIQHGFSRVKWPGRMEKIVAFGKTFWIDGTHNASGWQKVRNSLNLPHHQNIQHIIFGCLKHKSIRRSFFHTAPKHLQIHLVPLPHPHTWEPQENGFRNNGFLVHSSLEQALTSVTKERGDVLITGSLYLAGEVMKWLKRSPWDLTTRASL